MVSGKITVCCDPGTDEDQRFETALLDYRPIKWNDQLVRPMARRYDGQINYNKYDCESMRQALLLLTAGFGTTKVSFAWS